MNSSSVKIPWSLSPPFGRRKSLIYTLELLLQKSADPLIVEIGTSESYNPNGLGNALLAFAWFTGNYGGRVCSVDVHEGAVVNSRKILEQYCSQFASLPKIVHGDAYEWVKTIEEPIHLLYVDAGYELACEPNYRAFVERHKDKIPSFYVELFHQFRPQCFLPGSLMLIDDTDPDTFWGKGIHLIPHLLNHGWKKIHLDGEPVFPMVLLEKA